MASAKAPRKQRELKENLDVSSDIISDIPTPKRRGAGKKTEGYCKVPRSGVG
jgi:hypothetical protein